MNGQLIELIEVLTCYEEDTCIELMDNFNIWCKAKSCKMIGANFVSYLGEMENLIDTTP
jgi:hypothetical protein